MPSEETPRWGVSSVPARSSAESPGYAACIMKILNLEPEGYSDKAKEILAQAGELCERRCTRVELKEVIKDAEVVIVRFGHRLDAEILNHATRLKVIATAATGLDHIDLPEAKRRGIEVISLKGEQAFLESIYATAELTWGLLLSLVRQIPAAAASVRQGEWERDRFGGHELHGRTLGVVGLGRIGRKIAHYGLSFGMTLVGFDPYVTTWPVGVRRVQKLSDLLVVSDVLSIHVPLNEETKAMVGAKELAQLPPGAFLINTSRGDVLDEHALVVALKTQHLQGAACDVLSGEHHPGFLKQSPLALYAAQHDNLIITAHIGGVTKESWEKTEIFIAQKIVERMRGMV